ncbi:MAG: FGGY-family carbohydrate kinase, partial [Gammaproteobacteria bacterium]
MRAAGRKGATELRDDSITEAIEDDGLRDALDLVGADAAVGRLSGGGGRSELWRRIAASVLELPLERTAADEGAAFGAALLGGRPVDDVAAERDLDAVAPVELERVLGHRLDLLDVDVA